METDTNSSTDCNYLDLSVVKVEIKEIKHELVSDHFSNDILVN